MVRSLLAPVCIAALAAAAAARAEDPRAFVPSDYYRKVTADSVALSPDGKLLAYGVTTVDEKKNTRHRAIWIQPLKNGAADGSAYQFTTPAFDATGPVWSPDGTLLSFQSKRGEDKNTTWFARVTAPGGEAYHIEGVEGSPVWSTDNSTIAYTREPEDPEEKAEENADAKPDETKKKEREGWVSPDAVTETLDEKRFDGRVYTTMRMKRNGTLELLPHTSAKKKSQLFVAPAGGGEARQLTNLAFNVEEIAWAGDTILFTADEKEDDEYSEEYTSDIYAVSAGGGEPRKLTTGVGGEAGLAVSADGRRLAYLFTSGPGAQTDVIVTGIGGDGTFTGDAANFTEVWDGDPSGLDWAGGSRALRWSAAVKGNRHVFESSGREVHQVTHGDRTLSAISYAQRTRLMAYAVTDPTHVSDVFVAQNDGSKESRTSALNDAWLNDLVLSQPERLTWTVAGGTEIEGWLMKPVGYVAGTKYPMILKIHGGPHAAYGNYWFDMFHVLSGAGFFVLYTNPRGSSGYGHEFEYATRGKWGEMDSEDYLGGVDAALKANADIDPERVGVSGGSYGGFMTAWLTATTDRFACANASRMIANWESWYGASDAQRLTEYEFDGEPWEVRELYRRLSPLSYVENVYAPTLIVQSENDYRTPMPDAEQWYMALKKRGVPAELARYPRSTHDLSRTGEPWLLVDRLNRIKTWFEHWLIEEKLTRTQAKERFGAAGDL